ncbi:MAG: hypothetical protein JJE53_03835 [Candidatus Pacebacteria bacterium]|nr:hypothetical protein [Candidatus Paceibacterota bacterium]
MEKSNHKKYLSIKTKIILGIVSFTLVFMGLISYLSYLNFKSVSREDLNHHLLNLVKTAAIHIDAEKHKFIKTRGDEETEAYKDLKKSLQIVRDNDSHITYVYTMRKNDKNEIEFVVDAEESEEDISHIGDIYDDASDLLKNDFENINRAITEKDFTTDKWGTWLSGYAPFYDMDGKLEGIVGVDIRAEDISAQNKKVFNIYLITFLLAGLLASLVGFSLSKRITRSLESLTNMLKDERNLGVFPSGNDEVGELKNAFENILNKSTESRIKSEEFLVNKIKELENISKNMVCNDLETRKLKEEIAELKNKLG